MRIFITGGSGFIGSSIAEYHLNKGDSVHVVDDLSTGNIKNIAKFRDNPKFMFDKANIITWTHLEKAVSQADRVYHMAAIVGIYQVLEEPIKVLMENIQGCEMVLRAAAMSHRKPRIMIASSSSVYGHSSSELLSENNDMIVKSNGNPIWGYAVSKISKEAIALSYYQKKNSPITLARFFNTVGPNQVRFYGMVMPRFVKQACLNEDITVFGTGTQTRSFCDVRDVVVALDLLAACPESIGQVYNVGNNSEISINALAELVVKRARSLSKITHIPYKNAYGQEMKDITQRRPDLSKLIKLTSFKHQWTLEKTIDDLIHRFRIEQKSCVEEFA